MLLAVGHALFGARIVADAARAAAEGNAVVVDDRVVAHDGRIHIGVVNGVIVHAHDRSIVGKVMTAPFTTGKAYAHVAITVIHATVVAHVTAPVTGMEDVDTLTPAPVARSPKRTLVGSRYP